MGKLPWFKFFPGDWMKDPELRSVSSGARGLWIDMLSLMFESARRGYLQLNNGKVVSAENLARMTGNSTDDTSRWLQELEDSGVFSRTEDGAIYSRRQLKDERERVRVRNAVAKHRCNGDVTGDVTESLTSKPEPQKKKRTYKTGTRLPEDFSPQREHLELAAQLGINCEMEFQKFRDYWLGMSGSRGVKCDWDATLRNWLRNSVNYNGGGSHGGRKVSAAERRAYNNADVLNLMPEEVVIFGSAEHGQGLDARGRKALASGAGGQKP